ncbi:MAG: hypothetical protein NW218_13590 [Saprospiraceae bacterium]|nr:hypothetical protein [Saprospiraceae bacterium]
MKTLLLPWSTGIALAFCILLPKSGFATNSNPEDSTAHWMQPWIRHMETDFQSLENEYADLTRPLQNRLQDIKAELANPCTRSAEEGFHLLWERMQLDDALAQFEEEHDLRKIKLRYRKGVEIIKMLYEKILSMDHHFSSLKAQQEMQKISNPHNYPEFKEARTIIEDKMKKKFGFTPPAIFQANPYLSAAFSIVGLVIGGGEDKDKKADVEKIACIMDFTVRIHADMNVIFYETGYLREANMTLKRDCEALFTECARQVGYTIPLENCRNSDDWERLYALLDQMVAKSLGELNNATGMQTQPDPKFQSRTETNLQFAIDRTLQFINRYTDFVNQGNEYYKKFNKITTNYENEKACSEILPDQFKQLKTDIDQTLDKFNSAYRMPEVQGSKLKDMLYGGVEN